MTELDAHPPVAPEPRKGMPSPKLDEAEFKRRFRAQYVDPNFDHLKSELETITHAAWDAYKQSRKAPRTRKAGPGFSDPDYDLSVDWIAARDAIAEAQREHDDKTRPPCILLINGSPRNEHTCPGEMSKSYRLAEIAREAIESHGLETEFLDLSRTVAEYGRNIHPCKSCFSTSPALCHFPCSCYPNYSLGQTQDWMNDIYPMWARAHGVMIITPVHWYQATTPLKAMIDRMVCVDGGNPDPTSTQGKDAALAMKLELDGWEYPRHLKGRSFSVVVHGDVEGTELVQNELVNWLTFMGFEAAGPKATVNRYIGYWEPYAVSHDELDMDVAIQGEVRNAASTLCEAVKAKRDGKMIAAGQTLHEPRQK